MRTIGRITVGSVLASAAFAGGALALLAAAGCNSSNTSSSVAELTREEKAEHAKAAFLAADPGLKKFFDSAAGYAVFPVVGRGGFIVTVGGGDGVLYNKAGAVEGYANVTAVKGGLSAGGQGFKELIFFKEAFDVNRFKAGTLEFDASLSAVIAKSGASASADYRNGVAVFITGEQGIMLDASLGGQGFKYYPR